MKVSIVIPTANRPELLRRLLRSLEAQVFAQPFEIVVVDDCGSQHPAPPAFESSHPNYRLLRGEGRGPARARNLGAASAAGTYLIFLDDDGVVDDGYLARIVAELDTRNGWAVSGIQIAVDRRNVFSLTAEWLHQQLMEAERLDSNRSSFATSNGFALRSEDFRRSGGFHPDFPLAASEDDEFCLRWIDLGFQIAVLDSAAIRHHFPVAWAPFVKQQWRYGRGTFQLRKNVRPDQRRRLRNAGFYFGLLRGPLRRYGWTLGIPVGLLAAVAQGITLGGYFRERLRIPAPPRGVYVK